MTVKYITLNHGDRVTFEDEKGAFEHVVRKHQVNMYYLSYLSGNNDAIFSKYNIDAEELCRSLNIPFQRGVWPFTTQANLARLIEALVNTINKGSSHKQGQFKLKIKKPEIKLNFEL